LSKAPRKTSRKAWRKGFLAALSETGNVTAACLAADIDRKNAYRRRDTDREFAAQWAEALEQATDALEAEARRRAIDGIEEPVIHQGELATRWVDRNGRPCTARAKGSRLVPLTVNRRSDTLLIFLLKGNRPEKFKERSEVTGKGGAPLVPGVVTFYLPENGRDDQYPPAEGPAGSVSSDVG
jgi:hypothetical protein